jgi:arginine-tRNA-protein transferase
VHHGDAPGEVTPTSFKRFLVDSPLRFAQPADYPPGACPPGGFGSFHQQYWLDGAAAGPGIVPLLRQPWACKKLCLHA